MTSEERVLAIENDRADGALDDVGVEFDASVVEEADEPFPMVQTITKFVGDPGLARDARQLMLEPGPNPSYSRRSSIWRLRGFWDLGAHGFVRLFHRLTTDTFANALEG